MGAEIGGIVVMLVAVVLTAVAWYSAIRYKRQFPITMYLAILLFVVSIADAIIRLTWVSLVTAGMALLIIATLIFEKKVREKRERLKDANAEEDEVE